MFNILSPPPPPPLFFEEKEKKCVNEHLLMHHLKVMLILLLKRSRQKFYMLMLLSINDEVSSIFSQIVEQIEIIPEAVLSEVSKLIDSVISKRQRDQRKQFS